MLNCTALKAISRAPSRSGASARTACSGSAANGATGRITSSSPNSAAARCHGVTFAGNSPDSTTTRSPRSQGKQVAIAVTPLDVLVVSARSSARTPSSAPTAAFARARASSSAGTPPTPRAACAAIASVIAATVGAASGPIAA